MTHHHQQMMDSKDEETYLQAISNPVHGIDKYLCISHLYSPPWSVLSLVLVLLTVQVDSKQFSKRNVFTKHQFGYASKFWVPHLPNSPENGELVQKTTYSIEKNNKPMWPMLSTSHEVVSAMCSKWKCNLKALQLWLNHQAWCIRSEFPRTVTCLETMPPRWFWAKLSSYVAPGTWNISACFAWYTHLCIYCMPSSYLFIYICYISRVYSVSNFNSQPMVSSWTRFVEEPALGNTLSIGWMLGRS